MARRRRRAQGRYHTLAKCRRASSPSSPAARRSGWRAIRRPGEACGQARRRLDALAHGERGGREEARCAVPRDPRGGRPSAGDRVPDHPRMPCRQRHRQGAGRGARALVLQVRGLCSWGGASGFVPADRIRADFDKFAANRFIIGSAERGGRADRPLRRAVPAPTTSCCACNGRGWTRRRSCAPWSGSAASSNN